MGKREWKKSGCPFCSLNCTLEVLVEDDHIIDVRPNPDSVKEPGGYCCRKGRSVKHFQENPERIEHPLKKVGDHFEEISWEQAFREIGERGKAILDKYGPKSFASIGFGTASSATPAVALQGFNQATGAKYMYNPIGFEFMGLYWSLGRINGNQNMMPEPEEKNIDVIIYWGANSYVSNHFIPAHRCFIKEMSENEDKMVITVDPRLSETARMSDMHIMPRNGSDVLFIRGLIALILEKGWEDKEFLEKYCSDWNTAKKWFEGFDYKEAFRVAGVPCEQAVEFAEILTTKRWGCHSEIGMICGKNNTMNSYMLLCLMAVTGNYIVKGNVMLDGVMHGAPTPDERDPEVWRLEESGRFPVQGVYPDAYFADECLSEKESRHRFVIVDRSNPVRSFPDTPKIEKALDNLDLLVVVEIAMTETAKHADYVLPGKTGFETHEFSYFLLTHPEVTWFVRHPVIGQIGERKEDPEIILEIARAMGLVPEVPEKIIKAAEKSCRKKDLAGFMMTFQPWLGKHPEYANSMILMILDVFSRPECLGSVARAAVRLIAGIDYLPSLGIPQKNGFKAPLKYRMFKYIPSFKVLYDMSIMDQIFWAADADPNGVLIGYSDTDPDKLVHDHVFYPDHKIRLFAEEIDDEIKFFTPELQEEELTLSEEFDMVISSGNHKDSGFDNTMRNPDTYKFRLPYTLEMNPEDAAERGIKEGDLVRVVTRGGELSAPAELNYKVNRGYAMIPHHFGYDSTRYGRYGESSNNITSFAETDKLTGDPEIRYVPGRVEKAVPVRSGKGGRKNA